MKKIKCNCGWCNVHNPNKCTCEDYADKLCNYCFNLRKEYDKKHKGGVKK